MIINGKQRKNKNFHLGYLFIIVLLGILFFYKYSLFIANSPNPITIESEVFCDLETVSEGFFTNGKERFSGIETQSSEFSNSGKYSSKLDATHNTGISYKLNNPKKGARYLIEAWSMNPHPVKAFIAVIGKNKEEFYKEISRPAHRRGDYWERWELYFTVPSNIDIESLKIYVGKKEGENAIYFDDLKIRCISKNKIFTSDIFNPLEVKLSINKEGLNHLSKNKDKSISQGLVFHDGTMVKAKLLDNGVNKKVKIRHKGDWLDHMGGFPSYRIETNSEESWNGMQSFSVQEPSTRGFLREWVFFRFLDYVDIIRPRYDLINFQENNKDKVVFCYEEHFGKNLVENAKRREGPIVKMTEDKFWEVKKRTNLTRRWPEPPHEEKDKAYWASELRAFKEGKFKNNAKLLADFEEAQNLLHQYKYNKQPAESIFDLERMAKYLAMVDVCLAHHATSWHNQRFYYNPVTSLLEPIAFDAFGNEDPAKYAMHIYSEKLYTDASFSHIEPVDYLFYDDKFVMAYFKYLNQFSQAEFVESILDELEEGIASREKFIKQRFSKYSYNRETIKDKASKLRIALPAHKSSLQAFKSSVSEETLTVKLTNQHSFPLEILSGNAKASKGNIIYPNFLKTEPHYVEWNVPITSKNIRYKVAGIDSIYNTPILNWNPPKDYGARQELLNNNSYSVHEDYLKIEGDQFALIGDSIIISQPLVIPKNKNVVIGAGKKIYFKGEGLFLSYSPVEVNGTVNNPVIISSLDGKHGSFTVLQAQKKSSLSHVIFSNQNTLAYKNWKLTGAVNFYESDVDINNTVFQSNNCEDALNIIRSKFRIKDAHFKKTFADAFDADFCEGKIEDSSFENIGNDAIDVSGSILNVYNTDINTTGDKGISAGENSQVVCHSVNISNSIIGIASKDKSDVKLKDVNITDCETGFAAFQKKPEFGPATISAQDFKFEAVQNKYMIESGSTLNTN